MTFISQTQKLMVTKILIRTNLNVSPTSIKNKLSYEVSSYITINLVMPVYWVSPWKVISQREIIHGFINSICIFVYLRSFSKFTFDFLLLVMFCIWRTHCREISVCFFPSIGPREYCKVVQTIGCRKQRNASNATSCSKSE